MLARLKSTNTNIDTVHLCFYFITRLFKRGTRDVHAHPSIDCYFLHVATLVVLRYVNSKLHCRRYYTVIKNDDDAFKREGAVFQIMVLFD